MHTVVETPMYLKDAKDAGMTADEMREVVDWVSAHPDAGDEIKGTGGARKIRFAGKGKGKSGGYRAITFYTGVDSPVFLLNVFSKGDKVNLTPAERNELKTILTDMVEIYKAKREKP